MASTCPHMASANLSPPRASQSVYREDCTLCFDSIDNAEGLDVCLSCFNGGCATERAHGRRHAQEAKHPLAVNIKRTRKRKHQEHRDEPPQKISKLAIAAETDEDRYDTHTSVKCFECGQEGVDSKQHPGLEEVVQGVLKANTFAREQEVKAWEQEMVPCEHTLCLEQDASRKIESGHLGHCSMCDLKENLWLCLTCGNLGCGRAQFGGVGGNSHGLAHTDTTAHPVAVKLGSLTADGSADIYCYSCNEERIDPELVAHLAHWGIDIAGRQKTEKSLTEMQIEQNLRWEFSMMTEDGKEMKPMFGPGLTGLKNLGNSCYLNSIVQSLFAMPEFAARYYRPDEDEAMLPYTDRPAEDLEIQLRKMADGLLSGRYAKPDSDVVASEHTTEQPHQKGLAPAMLKHLVGRGHAEFSTMRQQDSFEFLLHLLQLVTRSQKTAAQKYPDVYDPVDAFRFVMEQKLQCLSCKRVRFRRDEMENLSVAVPIKRLAAPADTNMHDVTPTPTPDPAHSSTTEIKPAEEFEPVTLKTCLDAFTAPETVELTCPSCAGTRFSKQSLFATFPVILAINARRFELVNWVPTKQDVPVLVDDAEPLDLGAYRSVGRLPHEEELPNDDDAAQKAGGKAFVPNEVALEMLTSMGFPVPRCVRALRATGNADPEAATTWLFEHMDDADIDAPLEDDDDDDNNAGSGGADDAEKIEQLAMMGFGAPQARQALGETGGHVERAVDWLFSHPDAQGVDEGVVSAGAGEGKEEKKEPGSTGEASFALQSIVCHKGSSIHAGHYVAFVRKDPGWVLFNDEKVALGGDVEDMKKFAYVYFFRRTDA